MNDNLLGQENYHKRSYRSKAMSLITACSIIASSLPLLIGSVGATRSYTITSGTGPGGIIDPLGETQLEYGDSQLYTMSPDVGYEIDSVTVDGLDIGASSSYTFEDVDDDHTIGVSFAPIEYQISTYAGFGGSIDPPGTTYVPYGSSQTYTITPDDGYIIWNVYVDGVSVGYGDSYEFTYTFSDVYENHKIAAFFAKDGIWASYTFGGNISPAGFTPIEYGASQTYTFTPNIDHRISDVVIDEQSIGPVSSYTFYNFSEYHEIAAYFTKKTYQIQSTGSYGGQIIPFGSSTAIYGENRTYTFTPDPGFKISSVIVDGTYVGTPSSYTFSNITSDHVVAVTFSLIPPSDPTSNYNYSSTGYVSLPTAYMSISSNNTFSTSTTTGLVTSGLSQPQPQISFDKESDMSQSKPSVSLNSVDQMINQGTATMIPENIASVFKGKNSICVQIDLNKVLSSPESFIVDLGVANKDKEICAYYLYNNGVETKFQLSSDSIRIPADGKLTLKANHGCNFILIEKSDVQKIQSQLSDILSKYNNSQNK